MALSKAVPHEIAGASDRNGEVVGPDEEGIDPRNVCDRIDVFNGFGCFDLGDRKRILVRFGHESQVWRQDRC